MLQHIVVQGIALGCMLFVAVAVLLNWLVRL